MSKMIVNGLNYLSEKVPEICTFSHSNTMLFCVTSPRNGCLMFWIGEIFMSMNIFNTVLLYY